MIDPCKKEPKKNIRTRLSIPGMIPQSAVTSMIGIYLIVLNMESGPVNPKISAKIKVRTDATSTSVRSTRFLLVEKTKYLLLLIRSPVNYCYVQVQSIYVIEVPKGQLRDRYGIYTQFLLKLCQTLR